MNESEYNPPYHATDSFSIRDDGNMPAVWEGPADEQPFFPIDTSSDTEDISVVYSEPTNKIPSVIATPGRHSENMSGSFQQVRNSHHSSMSVNDEERTYNSIGLSYDGTAADNSRFGATSRFDIAPTRTCATSCRKKSTTSSTSRTASTASRSVSSSSRKSTTSRRAGSSISQMPAAPRRSTSARSLSENRSVRSDSRTTSAQSAPIHGGSSRSFVTNQTYFTAKGRSSTSSAARHVARTSSAATGMAHRSSSSHASLASRGTTAESIHSSGTNGSSWEPEGSKTSNSATSKTTYYTRSTANSNTRQK